MMSLQRHRRMNAKLGTRLPRTGWRAISALLSVGLALSILPKNGALGAATWEDGAKPRQVLDAAIEAMGGAKYLAVKNATSTGRYFFFKKDRKSFSRYSDWLVYQPVKWRFQSGKGKRQYVEIYNLELDKGWVLEGEDSLEDIPADKIKDFKRDVKRDIDFNLRFRANNPDVKLFYYGPDDVAGPGGSEAVELLDTDNQAVVIFFALDTHLPVKVESGYTDKMGFHHKEETEFYNWHWIDGVYAPLRYDIYTDGEMSSQRFLEELAFNQAVPPEYFLEPQVKEKKE